MGVILTSMEKKSPSILKAVLITATIGLCLTAFAILGTTIYTRKVTLQEVGITSESFFSVEKRVYYIKDFENKYASFLDDEKAEFICALSRDFNVDPDLVVAILEKENPTLNETATGSRNSNGTRDLGLFQLNDKSLFSKDGFLDLWWKDEFGEFNADNWKHNSYIAVKYIQDLTKTFGELNVFYVAAGYNAGTPRAYNAYINGDHSCLPNSTLQDYSPTVENNYKKWKALS